MKRLTTHEEYPHGAEGKSVDRLTGCWCRGKFEATACVEKLSRYEDTGLEPEEIMDRKMLNGWIPVEERIPESDKYILLSFENFSLPLVGRYEETEDGGGAFYVGDCDEEDTCAANDLYVNAWMPLPEPFSPQNLTFPREPEGRILCKNMK